MAPSIAATWRSFWHTMTSNDRHASHDSPYRTGRHIPLPQSRHAPLTNVATSALESRHDLSSSSYSHEEPASSNGFIGSSKAGFSPKTGYSPGLRSTLSRQSSDDASQREIPMQNFNDGLPPPPPVSHSWKRIDRWAEDHYEELFDNLCEGCTHNDVNELEHELDCTLPMDVRESLQVHDGQERGGLPTGLVFGCMLLDCEEIVMEWQNWRKVNEDYLTQRQPYRTPQIPSKAFAGASSSSSPIPPQSQQSGNPLWRQELLARQDSQPPNAVQKAYSHPAWIPLARDWGGNYLAVDLAPGPAGMWGQVIIYGRDYDCKYVIARSWAAFLSSFADDLSSSDKVWIDEDTGELKLRQFKKQNVEPPYLEILRWRCDQKHGRRVSKVSSPQKSSHRGQNGLLINSNVPNMSPRVGADNNTSPYTSQPSATEERGRSPHRFVGKGSTASPRPHVSSPLAKVAEEVQPSPHSKPDQNGTSLSGSEQLVSIDSPRHSGEQDAKRKRSLNSSDKENFETSNASDMKSAHLEGGELKTVQI